MTNYQHFCLKSMSLVDMVPLRFSWLGSLSAASWRSGRQVIFTLYTHSHQTWHIGTLLRAALQGYIGINWHFFHSVSRRFQHTSLTSSQFIYRVWPGYLLECPRRVYVYGSYGLLLKLVTAAFDDLWQVDSQLSASVGKKQPGKST